MSMTPLIAMRRYPLTIVLVVSAFVGCGTSEQVIEGRANVSGTVTFDGKPLPAGTIAFQAIDQPASTAVKIRDGAYFTDRVPTGKNAVYIDTSSIQLGNPAKYVAIPAKYSDSSTSGLTADIQPGENENVDFTLESK
jgi:hypothetical protein